ncbi:MAG: HAD family hydrolase [Patescibacteria group bacterium]
MSKNIIRHIWFDFSGTLAFLKLERHNRLRYESYANVMGKPVTEGLMNDYEKLFKQCNGSNASVFRSLGQSSNFWSEQVNKVDPVELYELSASNVPAILKQIKEHRAISLFSNIEVVNILPALGIDPLLFTNILSAGMVKEPKPALDGFHKLVELSGVPANEILYIGDSEVKDIMPAKAVGMQTAMMWQKSAAANHSFEKFEEILDFLE